MPDIFTGLKGNHPFADKPDPVSDLVLWTVYDHPSDYPDQYVARQFVVGIGGQRATDRVMAHVDLESIRAVLSHAGLVRVERHPTDDPVILETWL